MSEHGTSSATGDGLSTVGLILFVAAVIGAALALGGVGAADMGLAALAGGAAVTSFVASIVCFLAHAEAPAVTTADVQA